MLQFLFPYIVLSVFYLSVSNLSTMQVVLAGHETVLALAQVFKHATSQHKLFLILNNAKLQRKKNIALIFVSLLFICNFSIFLFFCRQKFVYLNRLSIPFE